MKWDYLYSPVITICEMPEPDFIDSNSCTMENVQMILTRSLQVCNSQPMGTRQKRQKREQRECHKQCHMIYEKIVSCKLADGSGE